jgi:hypothetical protein
MNRYDPVLCYVDGPWAYFTTQDLNEQWGDDWDDAPYEHNAGEPYTAYKEGEDWQIIKVAFDGPLESPADIAGSNSRYSVRDINAGAVAWLMTRFTDKPICVQAGSTLATFRLAVEASGGHVYTC